VPATQRIEVDIDGVALHGTLAGVYPHGFARVRIGAPGGNAAIRDGLDWLLASAAGLALPLVQFHEGGRKPASGHPFGPHVRPPLAPDQARTVLRHLLWLREQGLREPLPFAPYSGWEFFAAAPDMEAGLKEAAKKWYGSERSWSEGSGDALRLALRGCDPFTDDATRLRFADLSMSIYLAVTQGEVYAGTDPDALRALVPVFDAEDAG
jgi:exodeoxyribonuclease V gamma subunit